MAVDPKKMTVEELKTLIANHREKNATNEPLYLEALAELSRKGGKGLNFDTTKAVVLEAARENRFLSYKEVADASGVEWSKVHYAMGPHLCDLVEYAHLRGWPLLSAIVVNKPNVATGQMADSSLKGFIAAARAVRISVTDERAFLRAEQQRVFAWAKVQEPEESENFPDRRPTR